MINAIQSRPQSRAYKSQLQKAKPITRSDDEQQAEKCFQIGKQHQNRNDLERAQKLYLQAIIHNPGHFKSYCNLGLCYKIRGQYGTSIQAYKKSLSINNKDSISHYNIGNVYRLIGDYQKSIQHYLIVIQMKQKYNIDIKSLYLNSYNNLGICYKNIESYDKAVQCFEKIIREKPNDQGVLFNLAVCNLRLVRRMNKKIKNQNIMLIKSTITKTISLFENVLKSQPNNQVALLSLIQLKSIDNQQQQNLKLSIKQLDQQITKAQSSSFAKQQASKIKAYCLNLLAKYQESAQQYKKTMLKQKQQQEKLLTQKKLLQQKQKLKLKLQQIKQQQIKQQQIKQQQIFKKQSFKATNIPQLNTTQKIPQSTAIPQPSTTKITSQQSIPEIDNKTLFSNILSQLLQQVNILVSKESKDYLQDLLKIIQQIQKLKLSNNEKLKNQKQGKQNNKIIQKICKQLLIVGSSILGQKLMDKKYFLSAYQTYFNYFLLANIQTTISKDTLFLQTHRAIASVLTTLGYSQKAIQHYQIIEQQFTSAHMKDNDPLQELHSGLAVNYQSQGLHEKAIKQFEQAIRLNPKNYILYYNLGYCQHCAGLNKQAVRSYNNFLQAIQKQNNIQKQNLQSYVLQALISIFICLDSSLQQKLIKSQQIKSKFQQYCNSDLNLILKLIDTQNLMHYYLLACDLYQQIVFQSLKSNKNNTKQHKQKLLNIYINLLELPNCPDKNQILINCGNILFQEKSFLNALQFYQKVSKSKPQVFNIIALTLMNISQHTRAINCMQFAVQSDPQNKIYQLNYEIMKWTYGLQVDEQKNMLWKQYQCQCDIEFEARVQFTKSLINRLTVFIEGQLYRNTTKKLNNQLTPNNSIEQMTIQKLFQQILSDKKQNSFQQKQNQSFIKYKFLKQYLRKHCTKIHLTNSQKAVINPNKIKDMLQLIVQSNQSQEKLKTNFDILISKLYDPQIVKCSDYLIILQQLFATLIFVNTNDQKQQNYIKSVLKQKAPLHRTYQLVFPDPITSNSVQYPSKSFSVIYPSIQLKMQNIIQSLLTWQTQIEDQFVYLWKIVQTIAYKNQIKSPVLVYYNFPYCKNVQNCEKCLKKTQFKVGKMLNIDCKQNFNLAKGQSLQEYKSTIQSNFINKFTKNLQNSLKPDSKQNNKTLTFKLSEQTLPLQIQINFVSQASFKKFLKDLCTQLSVQQPACDKNNKQIYLILNKLIRVKCVWKQSDFVQQFINSVVNSPLSLRQTIVQFFDVEILSQLEQDHTLKSLISKIFDLETFLK